MDMQSSFPFWETNQEEAPANDDFTFFFSSPTTEVNELARQENLHNVVPQQTSPEIQPVLKNEPAELDTFLTPNVLVNPVQPKMDIQPTQSDILLLQSNQILLQQQNLTNQTPHYSEANSVDVSTHTKTQSKKRSLQAMQAVAKNQAPSSALSDAELLNIAEMQETDVDLMNSKEVYMSLVEFKKCLIKHGYRLTAVHLDQLPPNPSDAQHSNPFELVLNKQPSQSQTVSPGQASKSEKAETQQVDHSPKRASVSNTSEVSGPNQVKLSPGDKRPTKRARFSDKGESSDSREKRFSCAVCHKSISDFDTLVRHFRHSHQQLKPFSCPRCGGFYSSEGTLWHHIRNVHTDTPRKYKCNHCDASYDSFGAKTRHEHATHNTSVPQFPCSFKDCKRAFNFPAHLESHALQCHPGFRPFQCTECPKSFPSSNGLTRHCREVHQRPQAYSCSCSKSYSKRCHLKRHLLRVHRMSEERVQEEMSKQPHPGLLHILPPAPPALTE